MKTRLSIPARRFVLAALAATTMLAAPLPAAAQPGGGADKWQFEVTPYLFASALSGKTGVGSNVVDVDASFSDLLENIDSAFMAVFEARRGRWAFGLDGIYSKLKVDGTGPAGLVNVEVTTTEQIYQPFFGYRLLEERVKLDVFGAARYTQLDDKIATTGPGGGQIVNVSESWWNPVIGVRVVVPFAQHWSLVGYADVGVGGDSDSTYQALVGVNWQIDKSFTVKAGYRYLYDDYKRHWQRFCLGHRHAGGVPGPGNRILV